MTYPTHYPPQYPQPQYPQQPPQQPQYAPQYPQPPAQQPQYPQQPPQQPQPVIPLAQGSLDAFYNQPQVSSGPSWTWKDKAIGTRYMGTVKRQLVNADVQQETSPQGIPQFYRDGRPRYVMWLPLRVPVTPEFPDGEAVWPIKGQARDELVRAMAEAGAPDGPPEPGAAITVELIARRPSKVPGNNPSNQVRVTYQRPEQPVGVIIPPPASSASQLPPVAQPPQPTHHQPHPQPPAEMSPEQQELLARLTGQKA